MISYQACRRTFAYLASLLLLTAALVARAEDGTYNGLMDLSDLAEMGQVLGPPPVELFAFGETMSTGSKCPFAGGCISKTGSVPVGKTAEIAAEAQINTQTCKEINPGKWSAVEGHAPEHGTLSEKLMRGKLSTGPCAGRTANFQALAYSALTKGRDNFEAVWSTPQFDSGRCQTCEVGLFARIMVCNPPICIVGHKCPPSC